ncbi:glutamate ligase domain-containing protein [Paraflavitalea speifideaquila]|uniref:glutamate ligase domain-containing protein n=1 Tax=Paraflavitalea speifideaquila TaxID=3076558 RepID=UPI0028EBE91D|nr:cyanophycin synthetase [Paraflavitalea speifideiaquila]
MLNKLVEDHKRSDIRYQPYSIPSHAIEKGITTVRIGTHSGVLQVFGDHNLMNLYAAWYACRELGISEPDFILAIGSFTGAAKRLELLARNEGTIVYRDFAHAPSKVKATMEAVKQQYPERKLIAVLELHTYSSLNEQFMKEYKGAMDQADAAAVFYSGHALELKRMPPLPKEKNCGRFWEKDLVVLNQKEELVQWLQSQSYQNANLLLMSSGNYDGIDMLTFAKKVTN